MTPEDIDAQLKEFDSGLLWLEQVIVNFFAPFVRLIHEVDRSGSPEQMKEMERIVKRFEETLDKRAEELCE